jgi:uncharacterized membrane protein YphA (DoxX/SURF4 family)
MKFASQDRNGSPPLALLRITLGVIILVTWFDNIDKDLYTADGLEGFLNYLFSEDGNGSSLGFYESFVDAVVIPIAGPYGVLQAVVELAIGLGLVLGLMTRLSSLLAALFFFNLFLAYYGGDEWIWTYVLLFVSALVVFLGWGGRQLGVDERLVQSRGESPGTLLW